MLAIYALKSYYHKIKMKKQSSHTICLLIIVLFSILGMKALFHPGLFTAHDIWHQVVRFYYYSQAVIDGQFPPLWIGQLANGFGYPLFFFSYHLPWLIGEVFIKMGINIFDTIKILFFLSYLLSAVTMYFFVNSLLKNEQVPSSGSKLAALVSAILYLWLPYHFLIIFVGASLGIAFVFIFLPLVFWGINLIKENSRYGIPVLALGLSGITLSHIMHLIFILPSFLIFFAWSLVTTNKKFNFLKNTCKGVILWILVSSFYLMPATYYSRFTRVQQESGFSELYKRNFINFNQLAYSKWGYGPIISNAKDGENSFQLGFAQWISILTLVFLIIFKKVSKTHRSLGIYTLLAFVSGIFLMLDYSKPLWAFLIKFATLDFPFRLLLTTAFLASTATGIVLVNLSKKLQGLFAIFIVVVALYTNRNHINVNQYTNFPIETYLGMETEVTTNTFNEYLPLGADPKLLQKPWNEVIGENLTATSIRHSTNKLIFDLDVSKESTASVGQFYFPGQTLYLDNKSTKHGIDKEGRISFIAPQGIHKVEIKYQETPLVKISKFLSVIGTLIILGSLLKDKILKRKS